MGAVSLKRILEDERWEAAPSGCGERGGSDVVGGWQSAEEQPITPLRVESAVADMFFFLQNVVCAHVFHPAFLNYD